MPGFFSTIFRGYEPLEVAIEIGFIWLGVWLAFRFLRTTRGAGVIKGFALVVALVAIGVRILVQLGDELGNRVGGSVGAFLSTSDVFARLRFLADQVLVLLAIALVVVFQPEIRQAMSRLGESRLFRRGVGRASTVASEVADAVEILSRSRFGALIVIERSVPLGDFAEGGTELDARVSAALLQSIFWPNNPLHDLATVIRSDRVWSAGIQLPLAEEGSVPAHLGARHRAGLGITLDTDCVVVIVSEETGSIRFAHRGVLSAPIPRDEVLDRLTQLLETSVPVRAAATAGHGGGA
ncbi:MAG: diadenylate cyclase [Phycisphaerae bacterium]|nr:diadenylate cyclase [Phycisphaerae bacterium]